MNALEQCFVEIVEIVGHGGYRAKVSGHRWQDFAVTPDLLNRGMWGITHLPSGFLVSSQSFLTQIEAAKAMIEISKLRNRWVDIPEAELPALLEKFELICNANGGRERGINSTDRPGSETFNQYDTPTIDNSKE